MVKKLSKLLVKMQSFDTFHRITFDTDILPSPATINEHKIIVGMFLISYNLFERKVCVFN